MVPGPGEQAEVEGVHVEGRNGRDEHVTGVGQHQGRQEVAAHLGGEGVEGRPSTNLHLEQDCGI